MDATEVSQRAESVTQDKPIAGPMQLAIEIKAVVPLEVFTLRYALAVLEAHDGNKSRASKALAISRHALGRLVERARVLGMAA